MYERRVIQYYIPRRAYNPTAKDRWEFFRLGLATLYEGLVITLSLGYLNVEARVYELFKDE